MLNTKKAAAATSLLASALWAKAIFNDNKPTENETLEGIKPPSKKTAIGLGVLALASAGYAIYGSPIKMSWPVKGIVSSNFGNRTHPITGVKSFHNGIDIAAPVNSPVSAPANGTIVALYENSVGGKQLIFLHDDGFVTGYAHLNGYVIGARVGMTIKKGWLLAYSGNTGNTTGPHLHLTLRKGKGDYINPQKHFA